MSNKKQTAVEWLIEELQKRDMDVLIRDLYNQAKEMEKEQIMDAYSSDRPLLSCFEDGSAANEYYKETYENNH